MKYTKEFDGIRALAVLLVIVWHWVPHQFFPFAYNFGSLGVDIFFVLSGFLITHILLTNRPDDEQNTSSTPLFLKSFYARRCLRILPPYLLTILLVLAVQLRYPISYSPQALLANLTFSTNFYIADIKSWDIFTFHFWSVAVEEQFYLGWALAMILLPRKVLLLNIVLFILVGVIAEIAAAPSPFNGYLLPQACFHALGAGGLVAWLRLNQPAFLQRVYRFMTPLADVAMAVTIVWLLCFTLTAPSRLTNTFVGLWLLLHVLQAETRGTSTLFSRVLGNKILVIVGKVSYGMYLYHTLFDFLMQKAWSRVAHLLPESVVPYSYWIYFAVALPLFVLMSWLSWRLLESPILRLKKYFPYKENAEASVTRRKSAERPRFETPAATAALEQSHG